MNSALGKVVAFITRKNGNKVELLLFKHPTAGIQIPGGTVEAGEDLLDAVIRETAEETGLINVEVKNLIGYKDVVLPENEFVVLNKTKVYSRPGLSSFDWAEFRRGLPVTRIREERDFTQVQIVLEYGESPEEKYVTYNITGWVPTDVLTNKIRRHYYHLICNEDTPESWEQFSDNHLFKLFWVPISKLPDIVSPQKEWLKYVLEDFKYNFE